MVLIVLRFALLFVVLGLAYVGLDWYLRRVRARDLEAEHAAGAGAGLSRDDYVRKGMADYHRSWTRRSLLAVFVFPVATVVVMFLIANYG